MSAYHQIYRECDDPKCQSCAGKPDRPAPRQADAPAPALSSPPPVARRPVRGRPWTAEGIAWLRTLYDATPPANGKMHFRTALGNAAGMTESAVAVLMRRLGWECKVIPPPERERERCCVRECDEPVSALGRCVKHYSRMRRKREIVERDRQEVRT